MNTTNISGWRACAGIFSPLRLCILSAVLLATCGASAQTGNNNNNNPGIGQPNTPPAPPATNNTASAIQSPTQSTTNASTAVPQSLSQIPIVPAAVAPAKPGFVVNSARDVIALQNRNAPGAGALLPWPPSWDFASQAFVRADARHALKHTPMPVTHVSKMRAAHTAPPGLWDFPLSGPRSKLAPVSPPKTQPEKKPEPLNPQP